MVLIVLAFITLRGVSCASMAHRPIRTLLAFVNSMPDDEIRAAFAKRCETSLGHLKNVMYGYKPCSPELAVLVEKESGGRVTRPELRSDWHRFWPELVEKTAADGVPSPTEGCNP
ncbi:transcriptional regulator [Azohydromonas lata]|uniref:transcriptional regulator n=1 Tax=Azohydromonas lata TaxID=45677 RepID=UPI001EE44FD2|nr:YdaS family helix-turn-helix protein [Azohydromonas lata]